MTRSLEVPVVTRNDRRAAARGLAACAVATLALSGCGSPVRAGAAAVIGDSRISTKQLANDVDVALADPAASQLAADRPSFQRDVLSRLITSDVVDVAAQRQGVNVTPADIDAEYASLQASVGGAAQLQSQAAAAGLTLAGVRDLARTRALTNALGDRLTADIQVPTAQLQQAYEAAIDSYDQVDVAQIQLAGLPDAQALLPQAAALSDDDFEALARSRSLDAASKAKGGDLGYTPRSTFTNEGLTDYATAVFAAKVGATVAVAGPAGGYVVRVLGHHTTTLAQATPALRRTVLQSQIAAAEQALLIRTAAGLHVKINPRFGSWDSSQLSVVAATPNGNAQVSSPEAPAGGAATPGGAVLPTPQG